MSERARGYQQKTIQEVERVLGAGRIPLVVSPTGSGKTFMSRRTLQTRKRPVAIVHTRTLLKQTRRNIPEAEVLTIQGILAGGPRGAARRQLLKDADIAWGDEGHHWGGEDWKRIVPVLQSGRTPFFLSTATPQRRDGSTLADIADEMIVAANYSELIALGHLVPCDVLSPELKRKAQRKLKVRPDGVQTYLEHGKHPAGHWRAGIYCDTTIAACEDAATRLEKEGVRAMVVCAHTSEGEREELFAKYAAGMIDVLCSPMALSEGFDSPRAELLVGRRPFAELTTYIQWVGRILRPYNDRVIAKCERELMTIHGLEMLPHAKVQKERALFADCTGAAEMHGHPTKDREYSLEHGIQDQVDEEEEEKEEKERAAREEYEEVRVKYQLIRDQVMDRFLRLEEVAAERGFKPGWVFYRMRELGIDPPRAMESKYQSVCVSCRRRMKVGEPMLWDKPEGSRKGRVFHRDCFFESLSEQQLDRAAELMKAG